MLELPPDLVRELALHLRKRMHPAPTFALPKSWRTEAAAVLRADLEAAGIRDRDDEGRVADFHALRSTFARSERVPGSRQRCSSG